MRSDSDGLDNRAYFVRARKHDHVEAAIHLHQLLQRFDAVHFRHQYIQNDEVGPFSLVHPRKRVFSGADGFHIESVNFQKRLQILSNARLVIHHKNFFFHGH